MHLAFATSRAHPTLTRDDLLAVEACAALGMTVAPAIWDDPGAPWASFDAIIIRSTWDYHRRSVEFGRWLATLEQAGATVWNPVPLLRWNANKRYLADLARRGVSTVPTVWLDATAPVSLADIMDERGWGDVVVKPAISATAYGTHRVRRADAGRVGQALRATAEGEHLVQPFLPQIETEGEWSLMFFGGEFSHSVRKQPARGDFRVQSEYGGTAIRERAPDDVIEAAHRALACVDGPWLYARADGIATSGSFLLMELEMLEPSLFFSQEPEAARRFASALATLLRARSPDARSPNGAPPR